METFFIPALIGAVIFVAVIAVAFRIVSSKSDSFTKNALDRIYPNTSGGELSQGHIPEQVKPFAGMPVLEDVYSMVKRADIDKEPGGFVVTALVISLLIIVISYVFLGSVGILIGFGASLFAAYKLLARAVRKKEDAFMDKFPDALDMIARSVRSGFPLNTALRIIAENMDPPISTAFKQLVDEITYGRNLPEALYRMSDRVGLPDVQFFAVVLTVQQETGGSLAEVMTNLSEIIRKRKQLRMKIAALTSEGRATAIILGALPIVVLGAIKWTSPDYLTPLFETTAGNWVLGGAITLIILAFVIVNKMIDIDI